MAGCIVKIVQDDLWLCVDCTMAAVNGDFTALDNDPESADTRQAEIVAGLERLGPHLVPDYDSETDAGLREFSSCGCDCCESSLAGHMHRFAVLG